MSRWNSGDDAWFTSLYGEHALWLMRVIEARVNGNVDDAQDIAQETFRGLLNQAARPSSREEQRALLFVMATNQILKHQRAWVRRTGAEVRAGKDPALVPTQCLPVEAWVHEQDVHNALAHMSAADRELLLMRYHDQMTGPEIAKVNGWSDVNVRQRLMRARKAVEKHLGQEYPT